MVGNRLALVHRTVRLGFRNSVRKSGRVDFDRINAEALVSLEAVCRRLLPNGDGARVTNMSRSIRVAAIATWDRFKINLKSGVWADFASGDKGGDPVSLVAFIEDCKQGEAALKLARMLGLDGGGRRHG